VENGRTVAYADYGAAESARCVVFLHGSPGCHLYAQPLAAAALAPDRPGYGQTSPADLAVLSESGSDA
jgi:pimeloyl-ACP methyl ester carboxylesterase